MDDSCVNGGGVVGSAGHAGARGGQAQQESVDAVALVADLIFASRVRGVADAVGARVRTVGSASELLDVARAVSPRLIILDLDARGVDVAGLVEYIKSDPALAAIPVVVFGSHVEGARLRAAREAGADRVLARSAFVRDLPALLR